MLISKNTKLGVNVSRQKRAVLFVAFFSMLLASFSNVYADDYGNETSNENSLSKKSQATNFFANNEGSQNFFASRNFSSTTIFNSAGEPSLITQSVIEPSKIAPKIVDERSAADQADVQSPEVVQDNVVHDDSNAIQTEVAKSGDVDPSLKDVMEHSRKIREAIFGEGAASKLPAGIREKLQGKFPSENPKNTRF